MKLTKDVYGLLISNKVITLKVEAYKLIDDMNASNKSEGFKAEYNKAILNLLGKASGLADWYTPLNTTGNAKLDGSIITFSLPPVKACPNAKKYGCNIGCYANKSYDLFPSCRAKWDFNFLLAKMYPILLERLIVRQLKAMRRPLKRVRIHVSGDFFNREYVKMWTAIVNTCSDVEFWTYTKSHGLAFERELCELENLANINVVDSVPCGRINFGTPEYIATLKAEIESKGENAVICPCNYDKDGHDLLDIRCGVNCTLCANIKNVLFIQH